MHLIRFSKVQQNVSPYIMITFVTALIDLNEERPDTRKLNDYINYFKLLCSSNIKIHLFLSKNLVDRVKKEITNSVFIKNIFIDTINISDLKVVNEIKNLPYTLPHNRYIIKDTVNYMLVQHSKIEFMYLAILKNRFNTDIFFWIDIGISKMLSKPTETLDILNKLQFTELNYIYFAGKEIPSNPELLHEPNFRYCGSIFFGNKNNLISFYNLYRKIFRDFINEKKILTWEVNFWNYLEATYAQRLFKRYIAGHDETIIRNIETCQLEL